MFLFEGRRDHDGDREEDFDWSMLEAYEGQTPFLLGGGIGPDDAERIRNFRHPQFAGINLDSRFETETAVKDVQQLKDFMARLR